MTVSMYTAIAALLNDADKHDELRVVVLHGAGDSFTAGNDLGDFEKNPPKAAGSPQARFADALISFSKPLVAAVHGAAVGGGTTILLHFDFVYAAETPNFRCHLSIWLWRRSWDRVIWLLLRQDTSRLPNSFCWVRLSMRGGLWSWGS
jgi:hypothetical protein